jgi:hypothetical protein
MERRYPCARSLANLGKKHGAQIFSSIGKAHGSYTIHPDVDLAIRNLATQEESVLSSYIEEALRMYLDSIGRSISS